MLDFGHDRSPFIANGFVSGIKNQRIKTASKPTAAILTNVAARPKPAASRPNSVVLSEAPIPDAFRFIVRFYRLPRPIRRALWWYIINFRGRRKAQFLGTFGVSVYSALVAESLHPLSPLTTTLNYGVIGPDGRVPVRIVYDHRVMDGAVVGYTLLEMEQALHHDVVAELRSMRPARAA